MLNNILVHRLLPLESREKKKMYDLVTDALRFLGIACGLTTFIDHAGVRRYRQMYNKRDHGSVREPNYTL